MNLGELRQQLVVESGAYGLVVDGEAGDFTDNAIGGANVIINRAQRRLDLLLGRGSKVSKLYKTVPADETLITFQHARFVVDVHEQTDADE